MKMEGNKRHPEVKVYPEMPPNVGPSIGCNTPQGYLSFRKRDANRKTFYFMTISVC